MLVLLPVPRGVSNFASKFIIKRRSESLGPVSSAHGFLGETACYDMASFGDEFCAPCLDSLCGALFVSVITQFAGADR